jgi:hypothetical protein
VSAETLEANQPLVYGTDDRQEYFEVFDRSARTAMSQAVVALVPKTRLGSGPNESFRPGIPTWGDVENLCPQEPFRDQPAAAFCTGVLVDWDLVLTAGHCARVAAVPDIAVVFDYYYDAPGRLAARKEDVVDVVDIVAERLDYEGAVPRLDYAWFRLADYAGPKRRPVPVYLQPPPMQLGDPIVSIGAGGGVPIKFDAGGRVRAMREEGDYFIADVDASRGSSGAGAFTPQLALLGVLARGGIDFLETADGCRATNHVSEELATEQFTYAHRAVADLCAKKPEASSLCRPRCEEPCQALATETFLAGGGCSLTGRGPSNFPGSAVFASCLAAIVGLGRRVRSRTRRRR